MLRALCAVVLAGCAGHATPERRFDRVHVVDYSAAECPHCAEWNAPHAPVRVFGNTYWVGTAGLGAILVTSSAGHVLIDGALPASAPQIAASIRALGFRVGDVKLVLNSHAHFDHAGGIAAMQEAS